MTVYIAIFKMADGNEFFIEYRPCYDEIAGGIEILSVQHTKRPANWDEQREAYQRTPQPVKPRRYTQKELLP